MRKDTLKVVVRHRDLQGGSVVVLDLYSADNTDLPTFEAGSHIDLHLASDLVRQYSLCGDPADTSRYRIGVLNDPTSRGGSLAVFQNLKEGTAVTIGRPRNNFPLQDTARHTVLVGGGIGITPMIAMAYALSARSESFTLHYCARSASKAAFLDELASTPFADKVHLHFDDCGATTKLHLPAILSSVPILGTHLYVCGPSGFMDWVIATAEDCDLPSNQIHREYFNADVDTSGTSFEVVAAKTGKSVRVTEGQTIVAALASVGIKIEVSCEEGVCGTCVCTVLEGECDHRDVYLTDEEKADNDQIMTCCSRAISARLVLDV
jgi:ferredoxin-NADP reductase